MPILEAGRTFGMRQNSSLVLYAVLIVAAVILIFVIRYIFSRLSAFVKDTVSKKTQKKLDIDALKSAAAKLGLSKEETAVLINYCRICDIQELPLIAETEQCIGVQLKRMYNHICSEETEHNGAETEDKKLALFKIIHKIENGKRNLTLVTNSIAFPSGLTVTYTDEKGISYPMELIKNTPVEMVLSIAQRRDGTRIKPEPLSKIPLSVQLKNGIAYFFEARIVRYQQPKEFEEMVVAHTKNIRPMLQRRFKRIKTDMCCTFNAVKVIEKDGDKQYLVQPKAYPAIINDLSAGGCKIRTMLPIHDGQYIQIAAPADTGIDSITGIVVKSKKDVDMKSSALHIRFVRMTKKNTK
ncbi:PilZ domain-containing protein [Treponema sp. HNW]|uniref:PilZ domain-containing protein n=1 Tax=Treponema sp. HNW TaxID=3116654 RepID=UPI003D0B864B